MSDEWNTTPLSWLGDIWSGVDKVERDNKNFGKNVCFKYSLNPYWVEQNKCTKFIQKNITVISNENENGNCNIFLQNFFVIEQFLYKS